MLLDNHHQLNHIGQYRQHLQGQHTVEKEINKHLCHIFLESCSIQEQTLL